VAVEEAGDTYLTDLGELDEDDSRGTWPKIPAAEGAERGELREELRDLTKQKLGLAHQAWDPKIGKREAPLSRIDRDEVQAAPHRHAELMQRKEASCFRQFVRLLPRFSPRLSRGGVAQGSWPSALLSLSWGKGISKIDRKSG
jgi:hypothetical protein